MILTSPRTTNSINRSGFNRGHSFNRASTGDTALRDRCYLSRRNSILTCGSVAADTRGTPGTGSFLNSPNLPCLFVSPKLVVPSPKSLPPSLYFLCLPRLRFNRSTAATEPPPIMLAASPSVIALVESLCPNRPSAPVVLCPRLVPVSPVGPGQWAHQYSTWPDAPFEARGQLTASYVQDPEGSIRFFL